MDLSFEVREGAAAAPTPGGAWRVFQAAPAPTTSWVDPQLAVADWGSSKLQDNAAAPSPPPTVTQRLSVPGALVDSALRRRDNRPPQLVLAWGGVALPRDPSNGPCLRFGRRGGGGDLWPGCRVVASVCVSKAAFKTPVLCSLGILFPMRVLSFSPQVNRTHSDPIPHPQTRRIRG